MILDREKEHLLWMDRYYGEPVTRVCRDLSDAVWHYAEAQDDESTLAATVFRMERGSNSQAPMLVDVTDEADAALASQRNRWPLDKSVNAMTDYQWVAERGD